MQTRLFVVYKTMIKLTYEQYDEMEEICERIYNKNENEYLDEEKRFNGRYQYPTVEELEEVKAEENIDKYFKYLFYYYTQKFDDKFNNMPDEYEEYLRMKKEIKKIIDNNIVFIEGTNEDDD